MCVVTDLLGAFHQGNCRLIHVLHSSLRATQPRKAPACKAGTIARGLSWLPVAAHHSGCCLYDVDNIGHLPLLRSRQLRITQSNFIIYHSCYTFFFPDMLERKGHSLPYTPIDSSQPNIDYLVTPILAVSPDVGQIPGVLK